MLPATLAAAAAVSLQRVVPPSAVPFTSLNTSVLRYRPLPHDPLNRSLLWAVDGSGGSCGPAPFTEANVTAASAAHGGIFTNPCGRPAQPSGGKLSLGEWGYEFMRFTADMHKQNGFPCGELCVDAVGAPTSRADGYAKCRSYYLCRWQHAARPPGGVKAARRGAPAPGAFEFIGHYYFVHYGALWAPADVVGCEIGENINSVSGHLALVRGAARQFGVPFKVDFSPWFDGKITDYTGRIWGGASSAGGNGGHSLSLYKRAYHAVFMAGAGALMAEAGQVNWFLESESAGVLDLSPLGELGRNFSLFARSLSSGADGGPRGIPYAPIALLFEEEHGMGLGWFYPGYKGQSWDRFPLTNNELLLTDILEQMWPGSWVLPASTKEVGYMVAGPYGDIADVLLAAPAAVTAGLLSAYRVTVLGGDAHIDPGVADAYIRGGGVLVLTAAQAGDALWASGALGVNRTGEATALISAVSAPDGWSTGARPFCAPQDASGGGQWYIKVGGDPNRTAGWDGGTNDKCCRSDEGDCRWYLTELLCKAALSSARCTSCGGEGPGIGCPRWPPAGDPSAAVQVTQVTLGAGASPLLTARARVRRCQKQAAGHNGPYYIKVGGDPAKTEGWDGGERDKCCQSAPGSCFWYDDWDHCQKSLGAGCAACPAAPPPAGAPARAGCPGWGEQDLPVATVARRGAGAAVVLLVSDRAAVSAWGLLEYLLGRLADEVTPVALTLPESGADARPRVQMLLGRFAAGWQVTLINNRGVQKTPSEAPHVDPSQRVAVDVALKEGYGRVARARLATADTPLPVGPSGSVRVEIEAGDVVVVELTLAR